MGDKVYFEAKGKDWVHLHRNPSFHGKSTSVSRIHGFTHFKEKLKIVRGVKQAGSFFKQDPMVALGLYEKILEHDHCREE